MNRQDADWMGHALKLARQAAECGEVPVGAVLVANGERIGEGSNASIGDCDPTAHAEIKAIRQAARRQGNYRLPGTTLYVSLEPCAMCAGAIVQARIPRVVFASDDLRAGAAGSVFDILCCDRLNHRPTVERGLLRDESAALLRDFFRERRGDKGPADANAEPPPDEAELQTLAETLGRLCRNAGYSVAVAESCTGGMLAEVITRVPGSSDWFERGFVSYSNAAKREMLQVPADTLRQHGAVSEATALRMAQGALAHSHARLAAAITGIAGPAGGTPEKPVGTVCCAWVDAVTQHHHSVCAHYPGGRQQVRRQACRQALRGLMGLLPACSKQDVDGVSER